MLGTGLIAPVTRARFFDSLISTGVVAAPGAADVARQIRLASPEKTRN